MAILTKPLGKGGGTPGTTDHSALSNLDFEHAGHIGFASEAMLADYEKLAVLTTQDEIYTDLIPNNLLKPNQQYKFLFNGVYAVPNSNTGSGDDFHEGLSSIFKDQYGNDQQQYYDDGTLVVDGDKEWILLTAATTNSFYPLGRSLTFTNEQITFKQIINPITAVGNIGISGYQNTEYYMNGDGSNYDGTLNNYENGITITSVNDASSIYLGGDIMPNFNDRIMNGSFYMDFNDGNGTELYCSDGNEGVDWSFDQSTNILTDLTGTMDFTTIGYGGGWGGYLLFQGSYVGVVNYPPFNGNYTTVYPIEILSSSQLVFGGDVSKFVNRFRNSSFYLNFYNDALGQNVSYGDASEGTDWTFDPITNIFTDLTGYFDFTRLISGYCYADSSFDYIVKTFQGQIIGRKNFKTDWEESCDYRSQQFSRYKLQVSDWVIGSTAKDTAWRYNGYIWICVRATSSVPSDYNAYWIRYSQDAHYFSTGMSVGSVYIQIDTATKINTMAFNVSQFASVSGLLGTTVKSIDGDNPFDTVIYAGIGQVTGSQIRGKQMSILNSCIKSEISATNFILGDCEKLTIGVGVNSYLNNSNYSTIYQMYNSLCQGAYKALVFSMNGSVLSQVAFSTIMQIQYVKLTKGALQNTTANLLSYSYYAGYCLNNNVTNITNCEFYDEGSQSVFGNFIMSSLQDAKVQGSYLGNLVYGEMRFINTSRSITNNTFWNNVFTINGNGDYTNLVPLAINITGCTFKGGVSGWSGNGVAYLDGVTIDNGSYNLVFANGGQTNLTGCKLFSRTTTTFARYGNVAINGLTTYAQSYNNYFDNIQISNSRIGSFFGDTFGATGKMVNIYNSNISANINSCNADQIAIGVLNAAGLFSLQVSGGDSNTRIIGNQCSGVLGPITMNAGSQLTSSVLNGTAQNIIIGARSTINGVVNNGPTRITMAADKYIQYSNFNGLNSVNINHNINSCMFLSFWSGSSTTQNLSGTTYIGNTATDLIQCLGQLGLRTLPSDPLHTTPASRPAGTVGEIAYYSDQRYYGCIDAVTPVWIQLQTQKLKNTTVASNYSVTVSDHVIICNSASPITITLPTAIGYSGKPYIIMNRGAGTVTVATTLTQNINNATTATVLQRGSINVMSDNANYYITAKA